MLKSLPLISTKQSSKKICKTECWLLAVISHVKTLLAWCERHQASKTECKQSSVELLFVFPFLSICFPMGKETPPITESSLS